MSVGKSVRIIALCVGVALLCAVFYQPIGESVFGLGARIAFRLKTDCKLAYRAVEWREGRVVFSDLALFDVSGKESAFHLHAKEMIFSFDWSQFPGRVGVHLELRAPHLSFFGERKWDFPEGGWFDLSLAIEEGLVEWPGIERASFQFRKEAGNQALDLRWKESSLQLSDGGDVVEGKLCQFPAPLLKKLIEFYLPGAGMASFYEGMVQGRVHFEMEEGRAKAGMVHLEMEGIGCAFSDWEVEEMDGVLDWEGPFVGGEPIGIFRDFVSVSCEGRLRASLSHLNVEFGTGVIRDVAGDLTLNPGMGAKWEFQGSGAVDEEPFPFVWEGRGYFKSQMDNWVESSLKLGDARVAIEGREREKRRIWTGKCEHLVPTSGALLQGIGAYFFPEIAGWQWRDGQVNGEGSLSLSDRGIEAWNLSQFDAQNVSLRRGKFSLGCQNVKGHLSMEGGEMGVEGGEFQFPVLGEQMVAGANWSGQAIWVEDVLAPSRFSGGVEGVQTAIELSGKWNEWQGKGEFACGAVWLSGRWEEERMQIGIQKGDLEGILFSGKGSVGKEGDFSFGLNRFQGPIDSLAKLWPGVTVGGEIHSLDQGFQIEGTLEAIDWSCQAKIERGSIFKYANFRFENIEMEIEADSSGFNSLGMGGDWITPQGKVPFDCPILSKEGNEWIYDVRLKSQTWDIVRLAGTSDSRTLSFDAKKSHFFGTPLQFSECALNEEGGLETVEVEMILPWKAFLAAGPFLHSLGINSWIDTPITGAAAIHCLYQRKGGSEISVQGVDLCWKGEDLSLDFHAQEQNEQWKIDRCQAAQFSLSCILQKEEEIIRLSEGKGNWKTGIQVEFAGRISPSLRCELRLPKVHLDLQQVNQWIPGPVHNLEGVLEGTGHFIFDRGIETDLDFTASELKWGSLALENNGPIHLFASSEKGVIFRGIDLHVLKPDWENPWIDCKVDLLQYDALRSQWIFTHSHVHLPSDFLTLFPKTPSFIPPFQQDLDFIADVECASDFSALTCSMKEGFIPYSGAVRHIQNLQASWDSHGCAGIFNYFHQGHLLRIGFDLHLDSKMEGRLILQDEEQFLTAGERPLAIDWEYIDGHGFWVHAIEGTFGGIEASFHAETTPPENILIGSAHLHFGLISEMIPPSIAEVFQKLKMGKNYELKGHLSLEKENVSFRGLLGGKQLELFDYQFRTLLAQVELDLHHVHLYEIKISDSAGMMKIDEILLQGKDAQPWTISIPHLTIHELRPSLLQKIGREVGEISPLVVRELKIDNLKGLLDESFTYTAHGELHFINSYKREHTFFDIPADVLSRIAGLDLDLLIPVRGTLKYELKEGHFHLMELEDSFSESDRSQFFLFESPTVDLDGNLKILVKMKQFVLFKFTEAFLISIEGTLDDPKFHLQKKKRFLGM
ncbi:MAG TPA: hypothetical protein VLE89_07575 [Chlamydiales bacterium]|nr:hypothetical protein [Chlamydiales bacterium]